MLNQVMLVGHIMAGPFELTEKHDSFTHVIMIQMDNNEVYPVHIWSGVADEIVKHVGDLVGIHGHIILCTDRLGIGAEKLSLIRAEEKE